MVASVIFNTSYPCSPPKPSACIWIYVRPAGLELALHCTSKAWDENITARTLFCCCWDYHCSCVQSTALPCTVSVQCVMRGSRSWWADIVGTRSSKPTEDLGLAQFAWAQRYAKGRTITVETGLAPELLGGARALQNRYFAQGFRSCARPVSVFASLRSICSSIYNRVSKKSTPSDL
jgi:hypothetical protein